MSLIYDPSAIRYATTQSAYGTTWTLNKVEDDGAQVWKNTKGQEAVVPSLTAAVRSSEKKVEDWVFDGKDDAVFIPLSFGQAKEVLSNSTDHKPISNPRPIEREIGVTAPDNVFLNQVPGDHPGPMAVDIQRAALTGAITAKGNRYIQSAGRDIQAIVQTGAKMFVHNEDGMFAGKSYPYRKSCRKPNEGDRSVSAGNNFLYEYCNKEWWVIGQFGNFLVKPERANIYFNRTDNGRWEMPVSRAGDILSNTRIAGDGTTNLRWDGLKWRNVK